MKRKTTKNGSNGVESLDYVTDERDGSSEQGERYESTETKMHVDFISEVMTIDEVGRTYQT